MNYIRSWRPMALGILATASLTISAQPAQAGLFSLSQNDEIRVGADAARQIEAKTPLVRDSREQAMVDDLGQRIARVSARPSLPWRFRVLDSPQVNAFSLPGGYVYVYQGLIDAVHGDTQMLAGVLAHEIGHVSGHHQTKMMEQQTQQSLLMGLLLRGRTQQLAGLFANLYDLHFSRLDEYQADQFGVRFATQAGFDPYGLPRFLEVLQSRYGSGARGAAGWLQTHPATSERVRRAYQLADSMGGGRGSRGGYRSRTSGFDPYASDPRSYDPRAYDPRAYDSRGDRVIRTRRTTTRTVRRYSTHRYRSQDPYAGDSGEVLSNPGDLLGSPVDR